MSSAVAAAAAVARVRRRVIELFRENGATSPATAIPFHPVRRFDERVFDRFVQERVIVGSDGGRYFLDEAALKLSEERIRKRALISIGAIVILSLVAILLGTTLAR